MSKVWNILEGITSKRDWYEKVFDEAIVNKWREEVANADDFRLAINIAQSTAKGSKRSHGKGYYGCQWENHYTGCPDCREAFNCLMAEEEQDDGSFDSDDIESNWDAFVEYVDDNCEHDLCNCVPPDSDLHNYIEQPTIDPSLFKECLGQVDVMIQQESPDWHPGSNGTVLDIVHPSMYCYVRPNKPEPESYQWLPSEFEVDTEGKTTITSYVNNLDTNKYHFFQSALESMFSAYLPSLEKVVGKPLRNRTLQVIVKVASTMLTSSNPSFSGGSWHIEGMPYENIVGTALAYLDIDGITDSFLEFRKPVVINEEASEYPQNDNRFTSHHYGIEKGSHWNGTMNRYLGLIKCETGNSVVFPNSLQHRVKEFRLQDGRSESRRTILCFFLVDPDTKIVSTKDVPPQQDVIPREIALKNRERLMYYRKYFVDELNKEVFEREFSLCEH